MVHDPLDYSTVSQIARVVYRVIEAKAEPPYSVVSFLKLIRRIAT